MKNVVMKASGDILTITVDLKRTFGRSKSGKSEIIASTEGIQPVEGKPEVQDRPECFQVSEGSPSGL